jgi:hypothetical protein
MSTIVKLKLAVDIGHNTPFDSSKRDQPPFHSGRSRNYPWGVNFSNN